MTGQEGAQEVEQRCVGDSMIGGKATALHQQKVLSGRIRLHLCRQPRFAHACFTRQQDDLPSSTLRLLDQCLKCGEVTDAVNEDRADHWLLVECRHRVHHLLMKTDTTLVCALPSRQV